MVKELDQTTDGYSGSLQRRHESFVERQSNLVYTKKVNGRSSRGD